MSNNVIEKEKLHLETAKIACLELQRFFAKGQAIWVSNELDLVETAYQFSQDNAMFDFLGQNQVIKMQNRMSQNPIEKRS